MRTSFFIGFLALASANAVSASNQAGLSKAIYVERSGNDGTMEIAPAKTLRKGDTVVLLLEWTTRDRDAAQFISIPVPASLAFQRSSIEAYAVSVDGGRSWGNLGALRIEDRWGERVASVEDVTHLRWRVPPGSGRLTYSAIVR